MLRYQRNMRRDLFSIIVLVLFGSSKASCQGISFAALPIDLFCSAIPIRSIAFRPSGQGTAPDLIVCAGTDTGAVTILRSYETGSYGQTLQFTVGPYGPNEQVYGSEVHIVTGDLESDGDVDVMIYWNRNNVTIPEQFFKVIDNDGVLTLLVVDADFGDLGGFERYRAMPLLFDVNDDGALDVIFDGHLVNLFNSSLQYSTDKVLWATPNGRYDIGTTLLHPDTYMRHHDLNADGRAEIFKSLWDGSTQVLSRDQGDIFLPVDTLPSALGSPLTSADVSGDGTKDILIGDRSFIGYPLTLRSILLDEGWASAPTLVYERPSGNDTRANVEDFDLDGLPDILLWSGTFQANDQHYSVVNGNGALPFTQEPQPILQCDQRWHVIADVDGDEAPDLVIYDRSCVKWLRNLALSTGIAEQSRAALRVWPNPAQDFATVRSSTIDGSAAHIRIFGALGQELMTIPIQDNETRLDLRRFANGSYFIQVVDHNGATAGHDHLVIHR